MTRFLPYGRQTIEDDDVAAITSALRSDYLTTGPAVDEFEAAFAKATGASHAVVCNSGTAALHLAALALDLQQGEAAIVPTVTFLSTANVLRMTGAEVVFADVDPESGLMGPSHMNEALARAQGAGAKVRAVLPVHLGGDVCDLEAIGDLARLNNIDVVEDACHSLGETDIGACRHSKFACFSTHPVKAIATGEGGAVTTADVNAAARMRRLRSHGMVRDEALIENRALSCDSRGLLPWSYEMPEIGWNYRMPDILCALGISQLNKLPRFIARRRALAALYDALLAPFAPNIRPVPRRGGAHGWHLYRVLVNFDALGTSRRTVMEFLRQRDIGTQVHYIPVHRQPYYRERYGDLNLSGADAYYARCLSLPFFPSMVDDDVRRVVGALEQIAKAQH
jgi:UDP-4-amino-4,6-dideoxy-N-acetyl-beta-L-altrosamine transaminase